MPIRWSVDVRDLTAEEDAALLEALGLEGFAAGRGGRIAWLGRWAAGGASRASGRRSRRRAIP